MNGDRTAEQWAESANEAAQRTALKAREIADAALRMEQMAGRVERGLDELRREVRKLASAVAVDRASAMSQPRHQLASFTDTEWEDSPTGVHKIKKVKKSEWEAWQNQREISEAAKKWRTLWHRVRWAVWLVVGAAGIKLAELGVERLFHK